MIEIILIQDDYSEYDKIAEMISVQKDMMIVGSGKDSYDAIRLVIKYRPDIIIISASAEIRDGMEIFGILKRHSPETKVVYICANVNDSLIREMAKKDIKDCLLSENTDMKRLDMILRYIYRGDHYINSKISARAIQILAGYYNGSVFEIYDEKNETPPADFSKAEMKILRLIADGHCSKDIARFLCFNEGTVRNYTSSIIKKTKLKNRAQVVLYAREYGFNRQKFRAG